MGEEQFINSIRMDGEEWRDVLGFEGLYMVSSFGRVASIRSILKYRNFTKERGPILLKPAVTRGYKVIGLRGNGKSITTSVHRVVAMAFIPNPNNYPEIDHINCDRGDNRVENLRWCNHSMNMLNEITRKKNSRKGTKVPKLWKPVLQMKDGIPVRRFASVYSVAEFGFDAPTIIQICKYGIRKFHKGYEWMYEKDYLEREKRKARYNRKLA